MPKAKSLIYSIVLGGTVNVSDVRVTDNSFRDGVTLGGITVQQKGQSVGVGRLRVQDSLARAARFGQCSQVIVPPRIL
jgi:predicted N-acetyltransferase YhbS